MSLCLKVDASGTVTKMILSLSLQSYKSLVSVKENPDKLEKKHFKTFCSAVLLFLNLLFSLFFLNSLAPICSLVSRFKQKWIYLCRVICISLFYFIAK